MIKTSNFEIGDVIKIKENVTFFDFNYFENMFSNNGVISYLIKQKKLELNKIKESIPKAQKQKPEVTIRIKEMEEKLKINEEERKTTAEIIAVARTILPYDRFIMTNNCLVVINDECFRDNAKNVAFKYGGTIEIVGYVTNIITESSQEDNQCSNVFFDTYKLINQVLMKFYTNVEKIYVIHPLVMYY